MNHKIGMLDEYSRNKIQDFVIILNIFVFAIYIFTLYVNFVKTDIIGFCIYLIIIISAPIFSFTNYKLASNLTVDTSLFEEEKGSITKSTTLSIVIPSYNEENNIENTVKMTAQSVIDIPVKDFEIIVVDDGSTDNTANILSELVTNQLLNLSIIKHEINKGYGAALKTGFSMAKFELILFFDADGTYPTDEIKHFILAQKQNSLDIVVGSRFNDKKISEMPRLRRIGNYLFAFYASLLTGVRITDTATGMRILTRKYLPEVFKLSDGLFLTPEMTTRVISGGIFAYGEIPITYRERIGESKLNPLFDGLRFLKAISIQAISHNRFHFTLFTIQIIFWIMIGVAYPLIVFL